ncbi:organic hydroperoxide resistance protein [Salinivibrio sp. YCSC6]|nr:organic hydroperoxide resistance protein [Salinivibrio sp. YCSC6]
MKDSCSDGDGGFGIAVKLAVSVGDLDKDTAHSLVEQAHQVCPYSNATRGNIKVELSVV